MRLKSIQFFVLIVFTMVGVSNCILNSDFTDDITPDASTSICSSYKTLLIFKSMAAFDGTDAVNAGPKNNVWAIYSDGTGKKALTTLTNTDAYMGAPSQQTDQITYSSKRAFDLSDSELANSNFNVWVTDYSGVTHTAYTNYTTAGVYARVEDIDPNGLYISIRSTAAFDGSDTANAGTTSNIWLINSDGSGAFALTQMTVGANIQSFFNHNSTQLVFRSNNTIDLANTTSTQWNIWKIDVDGTSRQALTTYGTATSTSQGKFFSSGTKIGYHTYAAFDGSDANNAGSKRNIWTMNSDGTGKLAITQNTTATSNRSSLSNNGEKVYFYSQMALNGTDTNSGVVNIWSANADGTSKAPLTNLTNATADKFAELPYSKIAYQSNRALDGTDALNTNSTYNIWIMDLDGTNHTPITSYTATNAHAYYNMRFGQTICAD